MPDGSEDGDKRLGSQLQPHPDRSRRIRAWHIDRATSETRPVAMAAVHITEHGRLHTDTVGIEPEHAHIIAAELRDLASQLEHMAAEASRPARMIRIK